MFACVWEWAREWERCALLMEELCVCASTSFESQARWVSAVKSSNETCTISSTPQISLRSISTVTALPSCASPSVSGLWSGTWFWQNQPRTQWGRNGDSLLIPPTSFFTLSLPIYNFHSEPASASSFPPLFFLLSSFSSLCRAPHQEKVSVFLSQLSSVNNFHIVNIEIGCAEWLDSQGRVLSLSGYLFSSHISASVTHMELKGLASSVILLYDLKIITYFNNELHLMNSRALKQGQKKL